MRRERGTVGRVFELLRHLAASAGPIGIADIAESLDLPPSTVHRMVGQFVRLGMLQRAREARKYELGMEMFRLGALMSRQVNIVDIGTPALQRIAAESGESCALGLYREADATMFFAAVVDSSQALRYHVELFKPESVLWGASGRAILSHLPHVVPAALLKRSVKSPTGLRPLKLAVLEAELTRVREQGYAISRRGERVKDASGISAPIFGAHGRVIGCLSLTIPSMRYQVRHEARLAQLMTDEATRLSRALGSPRPDAASNGP
jgi:DNA-binding IclR family transcriptional regulator